MIRRVRTTLLWLLFVALPMQGFAFDAMHRCDAMPMQGSATSRGFAPSAGLDILSKSVQSDGTKSAAASCNGSASEHSSDPFPSGCIGMAACGLASADASIMPTLLHPVADKAHRPARTVLRLGFLTDAPDRPPRLFA